MIATAANAQTIDDIGREFLSDRAPSSSVAASPWVMGKLVIVGITVFEACVGGTADRFGAGIISVGGPCSLEGSYEGDSSAPSARQKLMVSSEYVRLHEGQRFMMFFQTLHCPGAVVDSLSIFAPSFTTHGPELTSLKQIIRRK
jgi:hypothetical protein